MELKTYLYLLPFTDGKYFKIGKSSKDFRRTTTHNENYSVDEDKSLIVTANNCKTIKLLERELLNTFDEMVDDFKFSKRDGYTEIRSMVTWDEVINEIKIKNKRLGIEIHQLSKVKNELVKKGKPSIPNVITREWAFREVVVTHEKIKNFFEHYKDEMKITKYPKGYSIIIQYGYDASNWKKDKLELNCKIDGKEYGFNYFRFVKSKIPYLEIQVYLDHYKESKEKCVQNLYDLLKNNLNDCTISPENLQFNYPSYDKEYVKYSGNLYELEERLREIWELKRIEAKPIEDQLYYQIYGIKSIDNNNLGVYLKKMRIISDLARKKFDSIYDIEEAQVEGELEKYKEFYYNVLKFGERIISLEKKAA